MGRRSLSSMQAGHARSLEEGRLDDARWSRAAPYVDPDLGARLGRRRRHEGEADVALEAGGERAAGDESRLLAVDVDGRAVPRHGPLEGLEANQAAGRA